MGRTLLDIHHRDLFSRFTDIFEVEEQNYEAPNPSAKFTYTDCLDEQTFSKTLGSFIGAEQFLLLNSDHSIGLLGSDGNFRRLEGVSDFLLEESQNINAALSIEEKRKEIVLGIVVPNDKTKIWRSATCMFSEQVFNEVVPLLNYSEKFRNKHRILSIYRAMDILLSHSDEIYPGNTIFLPIMAWRGITLNKIPEASMAFSENHAPSTPVLEVVNYVGLSPRNQRKKRWMQQLNTILNEMAIDKNLRNYGGLEIIQ